MEEKKTNQRRRKFAVVFDKVCATCGVMTIIDGKPTYVRSVHGFIIGINERWLVSVAYQDSQRIILTPHERLDLPNTVS